MASTVKPEIRINTLADQLAQLAKEAAPLYTQLNAIDEKKDVLRDEYYRLLGSQAVKQSHVKVLEVEVKSTFVDTFYIKLKNGYAVTIDPWEEKLRRYSPRKNGAKSKEVALDKRRDRLSTIVGFIKATNQMKPIYYASGEMVTSWQEPSN